MTASCSSSLTPSQPALCSRPPLAVTLDGFSAMSGGPRERVLSPPRFLPLSPGRSLIIAVALASSCLSTRSTRGEEAACQRSRGGGRCYISILSCGRLQGSSQASYQSSLHTHKHTQWFASF
ncbi:Aspartyl/glutamyl-tRNA(Asn/Gln) amidotransferase subunit B [Dissostichus eleginoides]|uniref:Aspartyl/glutamyl-tRNA(Asn/Gln) amidotransferase subunit B n=1 Tax=Dissostichus eleginoides TaxID=100907 RepID=A0AAD9BNK1_DISEL|nr:Aspartyl/glutamyl-tRNA(Asn/Gln) amidotransferase subunit B [Dissostichus eleginoides]